MEDMDNTIEIMKAAMAKEKNMKEMSKESFEETVDLETEKMTMEENKKENEKEVKMAEMPEEMTEEMVPEQQDIIEEFMEEASEDETITPKQAKGGKSLFKNLKSKDLAAKDQKIEELTDRLMRTMAEFDNFRKRSEKEKSQMYDMGVKSIVEKILPTVDNFERGLGAITEKEKESSFAQGIELIYKQFITSLEEIGVKQIEAVGKEFDPTLHNAVMHGEDENLGENIVSDEFQKGYIYRDIVVRHSMVKVVN